jgi:hypothetical protein
MGVARCKLLGEEADLLRWVVCGVGTRSGSGGGGSGKEVRREERRQDECRALVGLATRKVCGEVDGDGVEGDVGHGREGKGVGVGGLEVAPLEGVDKLLEQPTPVFSDDARLVVLLVGVVSSVEEAALVVGDYVSSDGSGLGRNEVAPGGLLHGVLGESPLRIELEELVEFAEFVELGGRRFMC